MLRQTEWQKMHESKTAKINQFRDRKFGMFIHFGLYSMLAGEWNGKRIEEGQRPYVAEWIMHAFKINRDDYHKLMNQFEPSQFSAEAVAKLAKAAGMKYVVITSKHHEGFALFDSKVSDFTIMQSPYGKDLIQDLREAVVAEGLEFGLYYSHSIDWMDGGDGGIDNYKNSENRTLGLHAYNDWDPAEISYDDYIQLKALPQVEEILKMFPDLCNIWFDVAYYIPEKFSFEFYKKCFEIQPNALISMRVGNGFGDIDCPGDNVIPAETDEAAKPWETVGTMNNSWGFKHYDNDWKSTEEVLLWLVDIVSKGGNYMLNIGPDGDGNVPRQNVSILTQIGDWLEKNGEAVYGTRPWRISHEGPLALRAEGTEAREEVGGSPEPSQEDWWYTSKGGAVYAIMLSGVADRNLKLKSLRDMAVEEVSLLENGDTLKFEETDEGLKVKLPEHYESELGFALRIKVN